MLLYIFSSCSTFVSALVYLPEPSLRDPSHRFAAGPSRKTGG